MSVAKSVETFYSFRNWNLQQRGLLPIRTAFPFNSLIAVESAMRKPLHGKDSFFSGRCGRIVKKCASGRSDGVPSECFSKKYVRDGKYIPESIIFASAIGELPEWSIGADSKSVEPLMWFLGFESLTLRDQHWILVYCKINTRLYTQKCKVGCFIFYI